MAVYQWKLETNEINSFFSFNLTSYTQFNMDYGNVIPTPKVELASTGYGQIIQSSSIENNLNYKVISFITGEIYEIDEIKPDQIIWQSITI
jgi:hypothetical protein